MTMDAAFPQASAVAITMPSTSPIAQRVRQWRFAWTALRLSDAGEQPYGRVVDPVVLEKSLERAEAVAVGVSRAGSVVGVATFALGDFENLIGTDVDELRILVDELRDQPGARDSIGLRALTR